MAYSAQTFVAGEQPTAAKWNLLWSNDASFNDGTGIGSGVITASKLASTAITSAVVDWSTSGGIWWQELGRTTLSVSGDTISVNPISAKLHLKIIVSCYATGGNMNVLLRFNNDSGNNYSLRRELDGAADATLTSNPEIQLQTSTSTIPQYSVVHVTNPATNEKPVIAQTIAYSTGASVAPSRGQIVGKWANTASQITRIDVINSSTGDFAAGSTVVVLGHD